MRSVIEAEAQKKSDANFLRHPERSRGIPVKLP
jgi:hypothetical protein